MGASLAGAKAVHGGHRGDERQRRAHATLSLLAEHGIVLENISPQLLEDGLASFPIFVSLATNQGCRPFDGVGPVALPATKPEVQQGEPMDTLLAVGLIPSWPQWPPSTCA